MKVVCGEEVPKESAPREEPDRWSTCHLGCVVKETDELRTVDVQPSKEGSSQRSRKVRMKTRHKPVEVSPNKKVRLEQARVMV